MSDENQTAEAQPQKKSIRGTANLLRKRMRDKWLKRPEDRRPCLISGCTEEGIFIPVLTIYRKDDPNRAGRRYVTFIEAVLCKSHETYDSKEFVPSQEQKLAIAQALGGEPDFDNMIVQYIGNDRVKVSRARQLLTEGDGETKTLPICGLFVPEYDEKTGKITTVRKGS